MNRILKKEIAKSKTKIISEKKIKEILQQNFACPDFDYIYNKFINQLIENGRIERIIQKDDIMLNFNEYIGSKEVVFNLKKLYFQDEKNRINYVYDLIQKSGNKGMTHDEISKKCEKNSKQVEKFQAYLSSHYCNKLLKLGLVYQNIQCENQQFWKRLYKSTDFKNHDKFNLLSKKELINSCEESEEEEYANKCKENCKTHLQYLQRHSDYQIQQTLDDNFIRILCQNYAEGKDGLFVSEIKEKLLLQSQKKYVPRLIAKIQATGKIDTVPFRDGKNFFKKIRINVAQLNEQQRKELKQKRKSYQNNEQNFVQNSLEEYLKRNFESYFLYGQEDQLQKLNYISLRDLIQIIKEHKELKNQKEFFEFFQKIEQFQYQLEQLSPLLYNLVVQKILYNLLTIQSTELNENKKKKKTYYTTHRMNRLIHILNLVYEHKYISTNQLSKSFENDLEKDKDYKIDRKTLLNICQDLADINIIKLKGFELEYDSEKVLFDNRKFKNYFAIYYQYEINDEILKENIKTKYGLKEPEHKIINNNVFQVDYDLKLEFQKHEKIANFIEFLTTTQQHINHRKLKEFFQLLLIFNQVSKINIEEKDWYELDQIIEEFQQDIFMEELSKEEIYIYLLSQETSPQEDVQINYHFSKLMKKLNQKLYWTIDDLAKLIGKQNFVNDVIRLLYKKDLVEIFRDKNRQILVKMI